MNDAPALVGTNLTYVADGSVCLRDVSVRIAWRAVTAICGPNGSGKTTLLELLAGVRAPTSGRVICADSAALVLQRTMVPSALPVTVGDVVEMGTWRAGLRLTRKQRRSRTAEALARVDLADVAGRPFQTLSGGQRQRVLIAQGIAQRARIFLLDEPAAGLDQGSYRWMREFLREQAIAGAAVVLVTHDADDIAAADSVIELRAGHRYDASDGWAESGVLR